MINSKNFVLFVSFVVKMNQSKRIWGQPPATPPALPRRRPDRRCAIAETREGRGCTRGVKRHARQEHFAYFLPRGRKYASSSPPGRYNLPSPFP
jgi:hypothetical protein